MYYLQKSNFTFEVYRGNIPLPVIWYDYSRDMHFYTDVFQLSGTMLNYGSLCKACHHSPKESLITNN